MDVGNTGLAAGLVLLGAVVPELVRKVFSDREKFAGQTVREQVTAVLASGHEKLERQISSVADSVLQVVSTLNQMRTDSAVFEEKHKSLERQVADNCTSIQEHSEQIQRLRTAVHTINNELMKLEPQYVPPYKLKGVE